VTATLHDLKLLRRPTQGRMVAGVGQGLAGYLNVDVAVVQVIFAILTVVGSAGLPLYVAGWLLIPQDGTEESVATRFLHRHGLTANARG
jgi:phage shock protein PspC (stress-responsive transcriptional regulator)